jgi:glyoxalase family protein
VSELPVVTGLHHVTAIAGDPQENLDFYAGRLGMRLVKRSVNQDVPGTYHLFYADGAGHPGSDLTFFPWPDMPPGRQGVGHTVEVALAVPPGSLPWWGARLREAGQRVAAVETRFGERVLPLRDPHGLPLALVETGDSREFTAWEASAVPAERQIRGLHGVRLLARQLAPTATFLTVGLDFHQVGEEHGWHRYAVGEGGSGRVLDLQAAADRPRGEWGVGSVHHIAWRVPDDAAESAAQRRILEAGRRPTEVIDRFWFKSVYFTEPGGALFEIATDGPGFGVDEAPAELGSTLVLPPWLEPRRAAIEAGLPPLRPPATEVSRSTSR